MIETIIFIAILTITLIEMIKTELKFKKDIKELNENFYKEERRIDKLEKKLIS